MMEVVEAIRSRRTTRKMKTDPISDEQLRVILEAIRWTPSWANTQCWEVVVVKDKGVKEKLATTLPPTNPALKAIMNAPVVLVMCGKQGLAGFKKGETTTDKGDWFMFDVGAATLNACLAAYSQGLGSVIVGLFDASKVEEILGVPEGVSVVALLPVGIPEKIPEGPKRKEISDFVYENRYQS